MTLSAERDAKQLINEAIDLLQGYSDSVVVQALQKLENAQQSLDAKAAARQEPDAGIESWGFVNNVDE